MPIQNKKMGETINEAPLIVEEKFMRKHFGLLMLAVLLFSLFSLAACDKNKEPKEEVYVVTYYDGNTVLKTENVKKNEYATEWTPEVADKEFLGWFGTPDFSHEFKFAETPITNDTSVFAKFLTVDYVQDTREWVIVGGGTSRLLALSSYGETITDEHKLVRSNKENTNEYTITLDLLAGDEFQFAINSSWNNQRGAGYLETLTANDVKCFDVKGSFFSSNTKKSNIAVLVDGNYTFTLKTYPNLDYYDQDDEYYTEENKESFNYNDYDVITWFRNGDPIEVVEEVIYDFYIKGQLITGWDHKTDDEFKMTFDEKTRIYTYTHQFYAGDEFMFYTFSKDADHFGLGPLQIKFGQIDLANSTEYLSGDKEKDTNIGVTKNGTYTFTYDLDKKTMTVQYDPTFTLKYTVNETWYIVGGGSSSLLSQSNWGRKDLGPKFQLTAVAGAEYTYAITLDLYKNDEFQIVKDGNWGLNHGFSYVSNPVVDDVVYFKDSGNICAQVAGNYTITLVCSKEAMSEDVITWVRNGDPIDESVIEYDIYIKTSLVNDWEPTLMGSLMSNGSITYRVTLAKDEKLCFVYTNKGQAITAVYPGNLIRQTALGETGDGNVNFTTNADFNFVNNEPNTYDVTIDFTNGAPVVDFTIVKDRHYEVIIKGTMTDPQWVESERYQAVDKVVTITYTLNVGDEFGFAWFDEDTTTSYGNWIGTSALGTTGTANESFKGANNYKCSVAGTYKFVIDFTQGEPVVEVYLTYIDVVAKGSMTNPAWEASAKVRCVDDMVSFEFTLAVGDELGFAWFDENTTTSYGNWIGTSALGTTGTANESFKGANNYKCSVAGTYRFVISFKTGTPVVEITLIS